MTTHDYALCDETQDTMKGITYFHFSETYDDNGIYFDYRLKEGVSNVSNAKYLMKLVGIG
jgi:DNA mismatch repair ATPase MutS